MSSSGPVPQAWQPPCTERTNIKIQPYTQVTSVEGENNIERIVTTHRPPGGEDPTETRDAGSLFLMIGATANTDWLPQQLECDPKGYICTGRDLTKWPAGRDPFALETNLPGVFCAGCAPRLHQARGQRRWGRQHVHRLSHEYLALIGEPGLTQ